MSKTISQFAPQMWNLTHPFLSVFFFFLWFPFLRHQSVFQNAAVKGILFCFSHLLFTCNWWQQHHSSLVKESTLEIERESLKMYVQLYTLDIHKQDDLMCSQISKFMNTISYNFFNFIIIIKQSISAALLIFWAGWLFVVGSFPGRYSILDSIPNLYPTRCQ